MYLVCASGRHHQMTKGLFCVTMPCVLANVRQQQKLISGIMIWHTDLQVSAALENTFGNSTTTLEMERKLLQSITTLYIKIFNSSN